MNNLVCLIKGHTKLPNEKGYVECPRCSAPFCWDRKTHSWLLCEHKSCINRRLHKNRHDYPRSMLERELNIKLKYGK